MTISDEQVEALRKAREASDSKEAEAIRKVLPEIKDEPEVTAVVIKKKKATG